MPFLLPGNYLAKPSESLFLLRFDPPSIRSDPLRRQIKVDIAFRSIIQAWMMLTSMMMTQSMSKADWMLAWAEDQRRLCT